MRKLLRFCFIIPVLLAGCAGSPSMKLTKLSNNYTYVAYLNGKYHFALVTDGLVHGGTKRSLSAQYHGTIINPLENSSHAFLSRGNHITMLGQNYSFDAGRLFLVSVTKGSPSIEQLELSEGYDLRRLADDARIAAFSNHNNG